MSWQPPKTDFRGYIVKAYMKGSPDDFKTAAVDVSSEWTHFPRYGYTSDFPSETAEESEEKIKQLSQEYYLNGYQFYDWMWRHDVSVYSQTDAGGKPLKDANGNFISAPYDGNTSYADLLGRHLYPIAVKQQAEAAQKYGSAAMAYQMNYAARENYEDFGVKPEWGLYNKNAVFPSPDPLKYQNGFFFDWVPSALYLQDPGNPEWQSYITKQYNRSVNDFGFDGIHLDQWGAADNDYLYYYEGNERYFSRSYDDLINAVKDSLTENNDSNNDVTFNMVGGMFNELSYTWSGTDLFISVPSLAYWEMLIIDQGNGAKAEIPSSGKQDSGISPFKDAEQAAPWAKQAVDRAIQKGLMDGLGRDRFASKSLTSRAETAQLLYRLLKV